MDFIFPAMNAIIGGFLFTGLLTLINGRCENAKKYENQPLEIKTMLNGYINADDPEEYISRLETAFEEYENETEDISHVEKISAYTMALYYLDKSERRKWRLSHKINDLMEDESESECSGCSGCEDKDEAGEGETGGDGDEVCAGGECSGQVCEEKNECCQNDECGTDNVGETQNNEKCVSEKSKTLDSLIEDQKLNNLAETLFEACTKMNDNFPAGSAQSEWLAATLDKLRKTFDEIDVPITQNS